MLYRVNLRNAFDLNIVKGIRLYKWNMYLLVLLYFIGLLSIHYYCYYQEKPLQNEPLLIKQSNQAKSELHYIVVA